MTGGKGSIALPQDAASHPASNVEWWYCFALLTGSRGGRYAVMASFFRVGELLAPKGHYVIHSLIRLDRDGFESHSELDRTLAFQMAGLYLPAYLLKNPSDRHTWETYRRLLSNDLPPPHRYMQASAVQAAPTRLTYGRNTMTFRDDSRAGFELQLTSEAAHLRLNYVPRKPVSIIDEAGELNGLRYYSSTRNLAYGELHAEGRTETLRGEGWFDHQWGRSYGLLNGDGWDWFGLQLDDGRELLVSRLRREKAAAAVPGEPGAAAKLILPDGSVLTSERVLLRPARIWHSEATGADYPVAWDLLLPDYAMELRIAALMDRQEMPVLGPLRAIWEGVVSVRGEARPADGTATGIAGYGFMELVGYPRSVRAGPAPLG
ncbi:lipocalin family protein [Cohnella sp. JJ-181]|uniref:lipocalin family protein n=1 Tax=Cohnella rhizoplanae TaxID=2974897 RepID=UPI0022FFBB58|nr:lipocalin family protein [Cohnella sp. JJ-181]CAI6075386.1 hypothetical protein COHCIP112018_02471 [Cohnella sp. JJ-181]